ncbi:toprim domain-containing protein [Ostreibacterium oceani]|uniref:Bifunctional DNA primase/helicase n=1 Tax=Ostreibacterium oceani TaxID=2654998 RepID=A0A6N7F0G2_9GAMM|nr:toprim domain-containing protein [Ostreibacterium oceani]MPV86887.1 bifunctional DNA primase/helicase [Ostreibacterium oceani]
MTNLNDTLIARLTAEYEFKHRGEWLQQGKCPSCGKKELFTHAVTPRVVKCNRLNQCAYIAHVKDLFPEIFADWSKNHPICEDNPNATADAYLSEGRSFDIGRLIGLYRQDSYFDHQKNIGTATVRFDITDTAWWERFIDQPERFGKKCRAVGSYQGLCWTGGQSLDEADEIWITEGIFDAIALWHIGVTAVSSISAGHFPDRTLTEWLTREKRPRLVWALDNDNAGLYAKNHVQESRQLGFESVAALPPRGCDWNDLLVNEKLNHTAIDEAFYRGALLMCDNAKDKGLLMQAQKGWKQFSFTFENQLFWFKFDDSEDGNHTISEIATCDPQALYFLRSEVTDQSAYYFRVTLPSGAVVKAPFSGAAVSSASEFKKRLLSVAPGALFTGTSSQLDSILRFQTKNIKTVNTIDFLGYDKANETYVFDKLAFKGGKMYELNAEDYFNVDSLAIKTSSKHKLNITTDKEKYIDNWVPHVLQAYGSKGIVALVFWVGSLFAEQIRATNKSYPFLEIVGEAGAGKSTLIEFLWRLFGRPDHEGNDPSKSSFAGRARNFNQVSNLPVVLVESDRQSRESAKQKGFDFDELKDLYNGNAYSTRGVKNNGNDTYEPPFKGAIVIGQNNPVNASVPILQRICHLFFTLDNHDLQSQASAQYLEQMTCEQLSYFIVKCLKAEKQILSTYRAVFPTYDKMLWSMPEIKLYRIAKNHAQLIALLHAIKDLIHLTDSQVSVIETAIIEMAKTRQKAMNKDHPLVADFFEKVDELKSLAGSDPVHMIDHKAEPEIMAINLNQYETACRHRGWHIPPMLELKPLLEGAKSRPLIAKNKGVYSDVTKKSVKCWCFDTSRKN